MAREVSMAFKDKVVLERSLGGDSGLHRWEGSSGVAARRGAVKVYQSRWHIPGTMTAAWDVGAVVVQGQGWVVTRGEAEQMGWGNVDFALNAHSF